MIIIACPGQGSQTPGFLSEWITSAKSRDTLSELSDAAGVDLLQHGTLSDADTIRDTKIAQPLIVAASLLAWEALKDSLAEQNISQPNIGVAGHSVGEFAAAAIAGIISPISALELVGVRGRAMADAAAAADTSMAAVVGGVEEDVIKLIEDTGLTPANRNGGGQIVAAGLATKIAELAANAPRGARVVPLQVAGAFHTDFMAPAIASLEEAAKSVQAEDPQFKIWTNANGEIIDSGQKYLELLVSQIAKPVRWDLCMESFKAHEIKGLIELTPAGALTGIAKRGLRGVPTVAVKTPEDIAAAVDLLQNS